MHASYFLKRSTAQTLTDTIALHHSFLCQALVKHLRTLYFFGHVTRDTFKILMKYSLVQGVTVYNYIHACAYIASVVL